MTAKQCEWPFPCLPASLMLLQGRGERERRIMRRKQYSRVSIPDWNEVACISRPAREVSSQLRCEEERTPSRRQHLFSISFCSVVCVLGGCKL